MNVSRRQAVCVPTLLLVAALCLPVTPASAEPATPAEPEEPVRCEAVDGRIVIDNGIVRIVIDPAVGGRIVEYVFRPFGPENLCFPASDNGGMLMDMLWQQSWPGELLKHPYEHRIVKAGPDEAVVEVWRETTGRWGSLVNEQLAGIRVRRTIRLAAGDRALRVQVSLHNTQDVGRLVGYWIQNNFYLLGDRRANTWYRPTVRGVDRTSVDKPSEYFGYFVEGPTAGWIGVANNELGGGLMLLMDYNDLWKLYTNLQAVTTEWFYDRVAIPPQQAWQTEVAIVPTPGLTGYSHGSPHVIAQTRATPNGASLHVEHRFTAGVGGLREVTVTTRAFGAREAWATPEQQHSLDRIDQGVARINLDRGGVTSWPAIVETTVTGQDPQGEPVTTRYAEYVGGPAGRNHDLITLEPIYEFARPAKHKVFLKPERIALARDDQRRVLFVRGLWHQHSGVDEAIAELDDVELVDAWYDESGTGTSLINLPPEYETLLAFDLVVLNNIDGPSLGLVGQEMLVDFVEAGGHLIVMGGDRTFGQGDFDNERFVDLLPGTLAGPADWRRLATPAPLIADAGELFADLGLEQTMVLFRHRLAPTSDADVLLRAGNEPLLVSRRVGAGTVTAFLGLPFGEPPAGQVGYWEAPPWHRALRRFIDSLTTEPES